MKVYSDVSLKNFEAWCGAVETLNALTENEIDTIEATLEDAYGEEGMDECELNDFLWFETDTIAEWLGYSNWEELLENRE